MSHVVSLSFFISKLRNLRPRRLSDLPQVLVKVTEEPGLDPTLAAAGSVFFSLQHVDALTLRGNCEPLHRNRVYNLGTIPMQLSGQTSIFFFRSLAW